MLTYHGMKPAACKLRVPSSGLLFRNFHYVSIAKIPYHFVHIQIRVTGTKVLNSNPVFGMGLDANSAPQLPDLGTPTSSP